MLAAALVINQTSFAVLGGITDFNKSEHTNTMEVYNDGKFTLMGKNEKTLSLDNGSGKLICTTQNTLWEKAYVRWSGDEDLRTSSKIIEVGSNTRS